MEINIKHGEQLVVYLSGRLDTVTSVDFTNRMNAEKIDEKLVIIDMSDLEYISSAGLRALLAVKKSLAPQGKELEVHNLSPICQEVFKVTGFKNILTVKQFFMKKKRFYFPILLKVLLLGIITALITSTTAIIVNYNYSINKATDDLNESANEALIYANNQLDATSDTYVNVNSFIYVRDYVMNIYNNAPEVHNARQKDYSTFIEYETVFKNNLPYFYADGIFMTRDYPTFKQNYNAINQILLNASFYSDQVSFFAVKDPNDPNRFVFICDSRIGTSKTKGVYYHCPASSYQLKETDVTYDIGQDFIKGFTLDKYNTRYIEIKAQNDETQQFEVIGYMFVEYETARVYEQQRPILINELLIMLFTSLAIILLYALLSYLVFVKNINRLNKAAISATDRLGNDEKFEVVDPNIKSRDEIMMLSSSFVAMENQIVNYVDIIRDSMREKERMNAELEIASKIQLEALPKSSFDDKQISVRSFIKPAKEVGGDFYDYFYLNDNELVVIMSDVSGKGIPASLFMMKSKELIKSKLLGGSSLEEVVKEVNEVLTTNNDECLFVTSFIGVINFNKEEIKYVNAGHEKPYIITKDEIIKLDGESNYVLGAVPDVSFIEEKHSFHKGDAIFMFTDGLNESIDDKREEFSYSRIEETLKASSGSSLDGYISNMNNALSQFTSGQEPFDDVTMMIARFNDASLKLVYKEKNPQIIVDMVDKFNEKFSYLDNETKPKVGVILDELINNYISYEEREDLVIEVAFTYSKDVLTISIVVNGHDYDPFKDNTKKYLEEYSEDIVAGGFGISIVKDLAKTTSYEYKNGHSYVVITL